jgi:aryl-alcohol dehydrogenase-like predicted oxidoreductase
MAWAWSMSGRWPCLHKAFELGINLIDTANIYGKGAAESFLGAALTGRPRDSYVLATKLFFPMTEEDRGLSRAQVEKQLDASLRRLKDDYIDLYQCHRYDEETPLEETMSALSDAVRSGKVRYLGFSEWPAEKIVPRRRWPASRSSSPASRNIRSCGASRSGK